MQAYIKTPLFIILIIAILSCPSISLSQAKTQSKDIETIKRKLDVTKVYKFLGFKKFMTIAKVTTKDTEQYLSKLDIGKCYEDKEVNPEYSLRINHNGNT